MFSKSESSGGREQKHFLLELTSAGAGRRIPPAVLLISVLKNFCKGIMIN